MDRIKIVLNANDINDEVGKQTEYISRKQVLSGDIAGRERLLVTDDALDDLSLFCKEGLSVMADILKDHIVCINDTALPEISIELEVSCAFPHSMLKEIRDCLRISLTYWITGCWLQIAGTQEEEFYHQNSKGLMEQAGFLLYTRSKPDIQKWRL